MNFIYSPFGWSGLQKKIFIHSQSLNFFVIVFDVLFYCNHSTYLLHTYYIHTRIWTLTKTTTIAMNKTINEGYDVINSSDLCVFLFSSIFILQNNYIWVYYYYSTFFFLMFIRCGEFSHILLDFTFRLCCC